MPILDTLRLIGSGGANRAMEAEFKRLVPRALKRRAPTPKRVDTQTLVYPFDPELAAFAVHYLRTPTRVLWDLFELESERLEPLYEELSALIRAQKPTWLENGSRISVKVPGPCDFPASGPQIRGTIKNAIIDGARTHGLEVVLDPEAPDVELTVRGKERPLVLGVDLAGVSMHERGWRLEDGEAPLKENLAAQILILSRWDSRSEALLDPMSGAGTIPIEGALVARGAPVFVSPDRPALSRLANFRAQMGAAPHDLFQDAAPVVIANEIHTPLVRALERNAERAGVRSSILALHGDLADLGPARIENELKRRRPEAWPSPPTLDRGLLVANPPYGDRLETGRGTTRELVELYEGLAALHIRLGRGWRAAYISANPELENVYGIRPAMKKPMWNGPIRAWLLLYDEPPC